MTTEINSVNKAHYHLPKEKKPTHKKLNIAVKNTLIAQSNQTQDPNQIHNKNIKVLDTQINKKRRVENEMLTHWDTFVRLKTLKTLHFPTAENIKIDDTGAENSPPSNLLENLIKKENIKTNPSKGISSSKQINSKQTNKLKIKKAKLESEYKNLTDSLRNAKRTNATLVGFQEKLEHSKISKTELKKILDNIKSICDEQISLDPESDESIKLIFIKHYAQQESLELETISLNGANLPLQSVIKPEEKNKVIIVNLLDVVRKAIDETNNSKKKEKILKLLNKFEKGKIENLIDEIANKDEELSQEVEKENLRKELIEEVIDFCSQLEDYLPKAPYENIMKAARYTKIRLLEIRPSLGKIESQVLSRSHFHNAQAGCLCALLSKSISEDARNIEYKLDKTFTQLSNIKTKLKEESSEFLVHHYSEKAWIDPQMQEIHAGKFSTYVSAELRQEKASLMVIAKSRKKIRHTRA